MPAHRTALAPADPGRTSPRPAEGGRVVVLGGGYAGLTAALRLSRSTPVTLIDATGTFTERIRLHEVAAGRNIRAIPLTELTKGRGITHITSRATGLDPTRRAVHLDDGRTVGYHTLVYALGSTTDTTTAPGAAQHALTIERAGELHRRLATGAAGTAVVVGGGLTGIELAAELAESYPDWTVELVSGRPPGSGLSPRAQRHIATTLVRLGVRIRSGARVIAVHPDHLVNTSGAVPADLTVWAASFTVPDLAARAGLATDARGRARVDRALRSVSHPDVFAVGDAAAVTVPGVGELRMACATAMPTGAHAATAIEGLARGRQPKPLRFRFLGQAVSLGRADGVFQSTGADDAPHGPGSDRASGSPGQRVDQPVRPGDAPGRTTPAGDLPLGPVLACRAQRLTGPQADVNMR